MRQGVLNECRRPGWGWYCVRSENHVGPCPVYPKFFGHPILWLKGLTK